MDPAIPATLTFLLLESLVIPSHTYFIHGDYSSMNHRDAVFRGARDNSLKSFSSASSSTARYSTLLRSGKPSLEDISTSGRTGSQKSGKQETRHFSRRILTDRAAPSSNPFLRVRRDAHASSSTSSTCSPPANLPAQIRELSSFLNSSDYISLTPEQANYIPLPTNQPNNSCPAATGSWWPRHEINLRSTCPWVWEELDNGPGVYPRYIRQAKCICQSCVSSQINSCLEISKDVTIFRLKGCQNGLALMEKNTVTVVMGCFCATPTTPDPQELSLE